MRKVILLSVMCIFAFSYGTQAQEFSITIDAEKDAFFQALTGPTDGLVSIPARSYLHEIGTTPPDGDADISAFVWTAWDEDYLYFYAEITDDIINTSNNSTYLNDCMEVKFDPDPKSGAGLKTANCRLTALDSADAQNEAGVDNLNKSGNLEDASNVDYKPIPADYARRVTNDGYALEFRVPLNYINEPEDNRFMVKSEGDTFAMAININDDDTGDRNNMLQWSAGHADAAHSNPALCGMATFMPNHILRLEAVSPRADSIVNDSAAVWYFNTPTGIITEPHPVESFKMLSNYPNPFNPNTIIKYPIKQAEKASLTIYNITGEVIRHLASDQLHVAGSYEITWDGRNDLGNLVNSGIYFCRLTTPSQVLSLKMTLIK